MRLTPSRRSIRLLGSAIAGAAFLCVAVAPSASAVFSGTSGSSYPTVDACQNPNTVGAGMAW